MSDQGLIQAILRDDKKAEEQFFACYEPKIYRMVSCYTRRPQIAEDWTIEIIMEALAKIRRGKISNPAALNGWLRVAVKHHCLDSKRKLNREESLDDSDHGQFGVEDEYKEQFPIFNELKEKAPRIARGLERSVEYAAEFFRLKQVLEPGTEKREAWEACAILEEARRKLASRFGAVDNETCWKYERLALEKGPFDRTAAEENELNKLERDPRKIRLQVFLWRPLSELSDRFSDPAFNPFIPLVSDIDDFFADRPRTDIFRLKIDPLKILYRVWQRGIRKGAYGNNALVISLLYELKTMTKGQDREFLFNSLKGETKDDQKMRFESLRTKSIKAMKVPLNKDLVDFIFKKCFAATH